MSLPGDFDQPGQFRGVYRAGDELSRIGPGFRQNRRCFAPNELGPTSTEALISSLSQFTRVAIVGAIATFHGMDAQPIAEGEVANGDGLKEGGKVVLCREIDVQSIELGT